MTEPYSFSQYKPFESKALNPYNSDPTKDLFKTNFGYQADDANNYSSDFKVNSDDFTAFKNIPNFSAIGGASTQYQPTWFDKAFGGTNPKTGMSSGGFAMPAVGLLQAGLGYFQGKDQLDFSKDQLNTQKQQFSDQFNVQKQLTNMDIMDHARARYARDPTSNANPDANDWAKTNLLQ